MKVFVRACEIPKPPIVFVKILQVFFGPFFQVDEPVARSCDRGDELIQFQLHGLVFLVLRALNQKHHQKCDDRRARIDYELPRIGKIEERPHGQPHDNRSRRDSKRPA